MHSYTAAHFMTWRKTDEELKAAQFIVAYTEVGSTYLVPIRKIWKKKNPKSVRKTAFLIQKS